jgi:hypothetical protein
MSITELRELANLASELWPQQGTSCYQASHSDVTGLCNATADPLPLLGFHMLLYRSMGISKPQFNYGGTFYTLGPYTSAKIQGKCSQLVSLVGIWSLKLKSFIQSAVLILTLCTFP